MVIKKKTKTQTDEVKSSILLLKKEARLLSKTVRKKGSSIVSENTKSLIVELVTSIRIDRGISKFSKAVIKEELSTWPFPNHD